ncbi:hypothetical protein NB037_03005 [Rathayibacter sp. ZW T2_19]|uniref:DUF732 domain-containing protein n=1 Tax=Rathayibacter rubneri TaxID=2950106 RepID=A0A9X2DW86_9MICO|nr:hypothetical protein [Rathayibacter rubneri]MCM6761376.1 hypothetical protein [Rathayibacter rubneri]
MKRLLLPVLVLVIALAGCATNEPGDPTVGTPSLAPTPSPASPTPTALPISTATPTPTAAPTTAAAAPVSAIPRPDADQEAFLRASLNEVDPALVGDDGVVNHSRDQCSSILGGASEESLIASTKLRFETATFTPTDSQAVQILDVIRSGGWCG